MKLGNTYELNLKGNKIQSSQYHILSSPIDASQPGATPRRKPGRPKGSKNKVTLEKESTKALEQNESNRGPGRPKGSLNKKTLAKMGLNTQPIVKHSRPGRPKGSKNKTTLEREAKEAQHLRRKPGRPKGSKNTPKMI